MLYFSLTTLTTTGFGDIVAVDPLARSLADLEAVVSQFCLAVTVAPRVTVEFEKQTPMTATMIEAARRTQRVPYEADG
jgi:hypothetical protein